jgi:hypothetical protein
VRNGRAERIRNTVRKHGAGSAGEHWSVNSRQSGSTDVPARPHAVPRSTPNPRPAVTISPSGRRKSTVVRKLRSGGRRRVSTAFLQRARRPRPAGDGVPREDTGERRSQADPRGGPASPEHPPQEGAEQSDHRPVHSDVDGSFHARTGSRSGVASRVGRPPPRVRDRDRPGS